jgi:hypothetical protein
MITYCGWALVGDAALAMSGMSYAEYSGDSTPFSDCGTTENRSFWMIALAFVMSPGLAGTMSTRGTITSRTVKVAPSRCILSRKEEKAGVDDGSGFCCSNIIR